jgi:hypothetical protein
MNNFLFSCHSWLATKKNMFPEAASKRLTPTLTLKLANLVPSAATPPAPVPPAPAAATPTKPRFSAVIPPADSTLYVILPYFNYCKFERRRTLFLEFVARYAHLPNVALVVVETTEATAEASTEASTEASAPAYDLPTNMPGVFLHFRLVTKDPLWIKENLINIAASRLPPDWRAMAWIDADLTFLSPTWVADALEVLNPAPAAPVVAQLFQTCCNLGPDGEVLKTDKGFAYQHATSATPYVRTHKYGYWHPGYAWACNRRAYEAMGGLVDWNIMGSGDLHMALAWIGMVDQSYPAAMHGDFKSRLKDFQARCKAAKLTLTYIKGTVLHHWHGRAADRKYVERWEVLTRHQYCPSDDIARNHRNGLYYLTTAGKRMVEDFRAYYWGRDEDRATVN